MSKASLKIISLIAYKLILGVGIAYFGMRAMETWNTTYFWMIAFPCILMISPLVLWALEAAIYRLLLKPKLERLLLSLALMLTPFLFYFTPWGHNFRIPFLMSLALLLAALPIVLMRYEEVLEMRRWYKNLQAQSAGF